MSNPLRYWHSADEPPEELPAMTNFAVFRCLGGPRAGNVDFCGVISANSMSEAEDMARLMYPCSNGEHLSVEEEQDEPDQEPDDDAESLRDDPDNNWRV